MAGIYIHIPFCKQACHYCDFHFSTSLKKKDELVKAIQAELILRKEEIPNFTVETIYFGGGTPSLLSLKELESIFDTVQKNYTVLTNQEVTLEANPDDLSNENIVQLSNGLINRLSIGIQSFFEEDLKLMNRAHNANEARRCLDEATKHFENISIDLIYGIQGMTNKRWNENIDIALSYNLPHISSYALTVEPKTALAKFIEHGKLPDVDDKQSQEQFNILVERLEDEGYVNYEISNFGKPGFFSHNNTAYWQGKPYLGIGPSAHSFDGNNRSWNFANNSKYIKAIANGEQPREIEKLSVRDKFNEYIMTGLRTIWGVSLDKVEIEFGSDYTRSLKKNSMVFIEQGLLKLSTEPQVLTATQKGKFLIDGIASELFILN